MHTHAQERVCALDVVDNFLICVYAHRLLCVRGHRGPDLQDRGAHSAHDCHGQVSHTQPLYAHVAHDSG
eukprot:3932352-Rhodomonas_salina.1